MQRRVAESRRDREVKLRWVWLQRRFEGGGVVVGGFGFHHIRTVFGFFRVGNSVFTILDSERDILRRLGRAGF